MNKKQQKQLQKEIMEADARDGLYETVTNNHRLTAVEWLGYELNTKLFYNISDELWIEVYKIFEQAKSMEKEQIIEAYCDGFVKGSEGDRLLSEEYYNETYNK